MESSLYAPENLQNQSMRTTLSLRTENWHKCQKIRKDTYLKRHIFVESKKH